MTALPQQVNPCPTAAGALTGSLGRALRAWPDDQGAVVPGVSWLFSWDEKETEFLVYGILHHAWIMVDLSLILGLSPISM